MALLLGEFCFREEQYGNEMKSLVIRVGIITGLFVVVLLLGKRRNRWLYKKLYQGKIGIQIILLGFVVLAGWGRMQVVEGEIKKVDTFCEDGYSYVIEGDVEGISENGFCLRAVTIQSKNSESGMVLVLRKFCLIQVLVSGDLPIQIGQRLRITSVSEKDLLPRNEGGFHRRQYYQSLGIYGCFYGERESLRICVETDAFIRVWLGKLRDFMEQRLYQLTTKREASVLAAILLGSKEALDGEINDCYQLVGIAHILSVSGMHVSLVGMCLYRLLRKRFGFWSSGLGSGIFVCGFSLMTGYGLSTKRAMIMFLVLLGGEILGRTYDMLSALSLAAIWILWETPYAIFGSSMQLSFGAVLGIVLLGQRLIEVLQVKNRVLQSFVMSESINLVTRPILIQSYYQIATMSTLVNLLVLPVFSFILYGGFLGLSLSCISIKLGKGLMLIPTWILKGYTWICEMYLKVPFGVVIVGNLEKWKLLLYYNGLFVLFGIIRLRLGKSEKTYSSVWKVRILVIGFYLFLSVLIFMGHKEETCVKMLDVGQGDCTYLETENGLRMLIDGGSSSETEIGTYTLLPFLKYNGVRKLDYVLVTHADKDHVSGILELLEQEREIVPVIDCLILPDIPIELRDTLYVKIETLAKQKGCRVLYFSAGMGIRQKDFVLDCLFPAKEMQLNTEWDKNELSLVCRVELQNIRVLFTGDLGILGESWLLAQRAVLPSTVLKVGHHGSKHSSSEGFLAEIQPKVALISCGEGNVYGHPSGETLKRLEDVGSKVFCTTECGQISIWISGREVKIGNIKRMGDIDKKV